MRDTSKTLKRKGIFRFAILLTALPRSSERWFRYRSTQARRRPERRKS